jgi:hypothetical protein
LPESQSSPSTTPPEPSPSPRRERPTEYAKLVDRVWKAFEGAAVERTGHGDVVGAGDPSLPLMGWCPVCKRGTVAVWLIWNAEPPRVRLDECSAGCPAEVIARALA